jgi:murein DD-endopeptidase MepM/ murein hydrolase activator NlpD
VDPDGQTFFEALAMAGALIGGAVRGFESSSHGGNFMDGFVRGAIGGIQIGGTIGLIADLAAAPFTGGATMASWYTPLGAAVFSSYGYSWNGMLGTGGSVEFGGGNGEPPMGGGETKKSRYEDPGTYLPGSGPGMGFRPGTGALTSDYQVFRQWDGKPHLGDDFSPGDGYVYARYGGVVSVKSGVYSQYGNAVIIQRDAYVNQYSIYAHLAKSYVKIGGVVIPGDRIAVIGNSGGDYKPHLHYGEFGVDSDGKWRYWDPGYNLR